MNFKATIITSIYNSDEFIDDFISNTVEMDLYDECEHIIVNANSPGNECEKLAAMIDRPNVKYIWLPENCDLYHVWNMCIHMSSTEYLTTANTDDRRTKDFLSSHISFLDHKPEIHVVSAPTYVTQIPNDKINKKHVMFHEKSGEYFKNDLIQVCDNKIKSHNIPHCNPMWRKNLHNSFGIFDVDFSPFSDWEFWLRCASGGARFWNLDAPKSLYFYNPNGLSTNNKQSVKYAQITQRILDKYF